MRTIRLFLGDKSRLLWLALIVALIFMYLYKLGSLSGGLSSGEITASTQPVGWHGIYHQPWFLPLKLARSVVFAIFPSHGQTLTRLPNILFGALSVGAFFVLARLWYGLRIAGFASLLFATSAWTLHVTRLASFDVMYFAALPLLLLSLVAIRKYFNYSLIYLLIILTWLVLLYIPGLVWLVLLTAIIQRGYVADGWHELEGKWRLLTVFGFLFILPLLIYRITNLTNLRYWLGLPSHFAAPQEILKQLAAVPVHLFVRGPQYPDIWLGKAPILDIFVLCMCFAGIYFFIEHFDAFRSRVIFSYFVVGTILVALAGPVTISLLVPVAYVVAATGLAFLLHDWLKRFPLNPLPRTLGLSLITIAVILSSIYNVRAYFIAWPHNDATVTAFRYHR
jgi:hypothetical protein